MDDQTFTDPNYMTRVPGRKAPHEIAPRGARIQLSQGGTCFRDSFPHRRTKLIILPVFTQTSSTDCPARTCTSLPVARVLHGLHSTGLYASPPPTLAYARMGHRTTRGQPLPCPSLGCLRWDVFVHMSYVAHPHPDAYIFTQTIHACAHSTLHRIDRRPHGYAHHRRVQQHAHLPSRAEEFRRAKKNK